MPKSSGNPVSGQDFKDVLRRMLNTAPPPDAKAAKKRKASKARKKRKK